MKPYVPICLKQFVSYVSLWVEGVVVLQLNRPVGSQECLDDFRLAVEQVVEDSPG